jgi:hypothetical protein
MSYRNGDPNPGIRRENTIHHPSLSICPDIPVGMSILICTHAHAHGVRLLERKAFLDAYDSAYDLFKLFNETIGRVVIQLGAKLDGRSLRMTSANGSGSLSLSKLLVRQLA